jgi:hypothetical protein
MQHPNAPFGGGGPPGPQGWGPPPGPYGAPPPGGFGAPGGTPFGPPGYGPPPPPPRSPNVGLFVALGCVGALVVLGGVGAAVFFVTARSQTGGEVPDGPQKALDGKPSKPTGTTAEDSDLSLELRDFRSWKETGKDTTHFVGELVNTGDGAVGSPTARIVFYDAAGTALDTGYCSSMVRSLAPGAKVPCTYGIWKPFAWKSYKIELEPRKPYSKAQAAELVVSEVVSTPKAGYEPHLVTGKLTNKSSFTAKGVWAIASLYGADGKIIAADNTLVAGKDLAPGGSGLFKLRFYQMADTPASVKVIGAGYSE